MEALSTGLSSLLAIHSFSSEFCARRGEQSEKSKDPTTTHYRYSQPTKRKPFVDRVVAGGQLTNLSLSAGHWSVQLVTNGHLMFTSK